MAGACGVVAQHLGTVLADEHAPGVANAPGGGLGVLDQQADVLRRVGVDQLDGLLDGRNDGGDAMLSNGTVGDFGAFQ